MAAGLYIHIPFCLSKCPYCDFYSVKYDAVLADSYVQKVILEMQKYSGTFDTVYFGGGTPSALEPEQICRLLTAAKKQFQITADAEITVECNPSKNLAKDFEIYATAGINRLSIGMQSAVNRERFALGRRAGAAQVMQAVTDAKAAGIYNISLDVMLGTPKQTLQSLDETFAFIAQAEVTHVSAYMLKIEKGTKFFELQNKLDLPKEDTVCDMYMKAVEELQKIGFQQYEISNFAKPGFASRHNTKYWTLEPYLGLGASAHSFWHGKRFFYDENMHRIQDGEGGTMEERIMLGLRLNKGIEKELLKKDFSRFVKMGFMRETDKKIALTPQGMLVSNTIISELL